VSAAATPRVLLLHKPRGVIVSTLPEGGAPTVFSLLPEERWSWCCVGRLDKDSEGALLFCSDSRRAQRLMDPGGIAKTYVVTVRGLPAEADLVPMRRGGFEVDGRPLSPAAVRRLGKAPRGGTRLEVVLHEGRNRQIRRMFAAAGFKVRRLVRVAVGPVALGDLPPGAWRELDEDEVARLMDFRSHP
jgi:pseudouridine synthase